MQTLYQATQILDLNIKENGKSMPPDLKDALILGVQCIQRVQEGRDKLMSFCLALLPYEATGYYK